MTDGVEYEPVSVKQVLGEMKDTAELLVDLSYSAVLFDDAGLAAEVLELEAGMDLLQLQAWMSLVLAGRSPSEAEELAPVFGVVGAAEKVSDAAGDVAKVVREEVDLPVAFRGALPDAVEALARATVAPDSPYAGRTLGAIDLETETGVRVIAVRRGEEWLLRPDRDTEVRAGDVLTCRGPESGLAEVYETVTGEPYATPDPSEPAVEDLDRAVETVVLMKETSELAVDLAYGSVLFDDADLAREVAELEVEVDSLRSRFEAWALRAAATVDDPVSIRGLLRIGVSTEMISDAALEISEGVLRGAAGHPVVEAAVRESAEVIVRETVAAGSRLDGATLGDAGLAAESGMTVVAVRRADGVDGESGDAGDGADGSTASRDRTRRAADTRYLLSPSAGTVLRAGDVVIAKGTRRGADRLADAVGDGS